MNQGACRHCGQPHPAERVPFRALCERCDAALHVCEQCRFFAPGKPNDCNEPNAEPVREKELPNRCEWFRLGDGGPVDRGLSKSDADAMLRDLFKKDS